MSVSSALLAGVSGLIANSSALAAISDNIANVNTNGYKRSQLNFSDVITGQSVPGRYAAGGVSGVNRQFVAQQGLLQSTNSSTDLAITGDGLFVTAEKAIPAASDPRLFTRAGSFHTDSKGYLANDAGLYVQGWLANSAGVITTDPADLTKLSSINIRSVGSVVNPTTQVDINGNLNSTQAASAPKLAAYNALSNSMAAYDPTLATGTQPDYTIPTKITDSLGNTHQVAISFLKTATANQWQAEIYSIPASDVTSGSSLAPGQIAAGVVAFQPDGSLDTVNTTLFANPLAPSITLGASAAGAPAATGANWASTLGINGQSVGYGIASSPGTLTQLASASAVKSILDNGVGVGSLSGIKISDVGLISASFDNGQTRIIGQLAIATFPNSDGLTAASGNAYRNSIASGGYTLNVANQGGAGKVASASLEASTVDLSSEFTGLITVQRAYSASSKIITTADEILQELISIKR
jgi:flagellar hook protein FlgE